VSSPLDLFLACLEWFYVDQFVGAVKDLLIVGIPADAVNR